MHNYLNQYISSTVLASVITLATFAIAGPQLSRESVFFQIGKYPNFKLEGNIKRFVGERLDIDISFLWFDKAAVARVGLYEQNGVLYSILEAETKGFVGFFTSYRKHFYKWHQNKDRRKA